MIAFFDSALDVAMRVTPWGTGIALLIGLLSSALRKGVLIGIAIALVGGVATCAHFYGQDSGWGWGNLSAIFIGFEGACSEFLLGFGGYLVARSGFRARGAFVVLFALFLPIAGFGFGIIRPRYVARETVVWQSVITTGKIEHDIEFYRANFSQPTRRAMEERVGRVEQGIIPTRALQLLDAFGVDVAMHPNLSEEMARRFYSHPRNQWTRQIVAQNPSIPASLQTEIARSSDFRELRALASNLRLDPALRDDLSKKFSETLAAAKTKKIDGSVYSDCEEGLRALRRNAQQ